MNAAAYWPWWAGALLLASITVTYRYFTGFALGISGTMTKLLHWREDTSLRESEVMLHELASDPAALEAELLRATEAHLKTQAPTAAVAAAPSEPAPVPGASCTPPDDLPAVRPSALQNLLLLTMVSAGGALSAALAGRWAFTTDMGPTFDHLLAGGWQQVPILLVGGILVGAGTRMAGGCSSGHGLSGCSRFHPSSLAATAAFFGAGVAVSLLLQAVAS